MGIRNQFALVEEGDGQIADVYLVAYKDTDKLRIALSQEWADGYRKVVINLNKSQVEDLKDFCQQFLDGKIV